MDAPATLTRRDGMRVLSGRGDAHAVAALWREALAAVTPGTTLPIDLSGCGYCDVSGAALLLALEDKAGSRAALSGASPGTARVIGRAHETYRTSPLPAPRRPRTCGGGGRGRGRQDRRSRRAHRDPGRTATAAALTALDPRSLRWPDTWRQAEQAGSRALPIRRVGFLFGLTLAFESARCARR